MTCGSHDLRAARPTCRRLLAWSNHHNLFPRATPAAAGWGLGETSRAHSVLWARVSRPLRWFTTGLPEICSLSRPEDDLGEPLAHRPVVVHPGETEVFEGCMAQNLKEAVVRCLRRKGAVADLVQQRADLMTVHRSKYLGFVDLAVSRAVISPIGVRNGLIFL